MCGYPLISLGRNVYSKGMVRLHSIYTPVVFSLRHSLLYSFIMFLRNSGDVTMPGCWKRDVECSVVFFQGSGMGPLAPLTNGGYVWN